MNTENSKKNEQHRFKLDLTDKLNLKNPNKNIDLVFITLGKTSNQNIKTINLRFLHQLGMILLIYQIVLTQFLTFKIMLNLSSKNMKL